MSSILGEWSNLFSRTNHFFKQSDESYFLEASLSSLLCSAACATGAIAIAEAKVCKDEGPNCQSWNGRCDTVFGISPEHVVGIESKLHWLTKEWTKKQIEEGLKLAKNDACNLADQVFGRTINDKVGILFGLFWSSNIPRTESEESNLEQLIQQLEIGPDFFAISKTSEHNNCPRAFLIGKAAN